MPIRINQNEGTIVATPGSTLEIEVVPIDSVKLWKDNPRKNERAIPGIMASIRAHGFRTPLVVWSKNRTIYKGNTSWKAAKKLGISRVPILLVDFPSESAAAAYGIDDNKTGEVSGWDKDLLQKLMSSSMVKNTVTSFSTKEFDTFQKGIFARKLDVKEILKYVEDDDTFDICVTVPPKDKARIMQLVNNALKGTGYEASAY